MNLPPEIPDLAAALGALVTMVFATLTPFPAEIAALAVAMSHGFWLGFVLIWSGAMLGALLGHVLADRICRRIPWFEHNASVRAAKARMHDLGFLGILGLRLVPLVPFFALSLAAGLLRVPLPAYLAGTALGMLPATLILSLLGEGLISNRTGILVIAVVALVALPPLVWLGLRRLRHRGASPALPEPANFPRTPTQPERRTR